MLALTGDYPELEGTIGGNPGYSSRRQACAAGFAWSDLLNMGKDITEEYAEFSSPINYVNPSAPPIALFGGYGDPGVNIAFKQSLRTFDALNSVDVLAFLYGNTNGKYGENPETIESIRKFFIQQLIEEKKR